MTKKICSKCSYEQKQKRRCSLLRGSTNSSCMTMQNSINQRKNIKELGKKCTDELFGNFQERIDNRDKHDFVNNDLIN